MNKTLSTVYKRELKLCFSSVAGWLFIAINMAVLGVCAVWLCFKNLNPGFQYVPETASIAVCFTAPLLCALTVSTEAKRGESSLILRYASPMALAMGRYLAHLTVFAIPAIFSALLPLIMLPFGLSDLFTPYLGVICYILVCAALMALSLFIATLVRQPIVGAIISAAVSMLLNIGSNVAETVGKGNVVPFAISAVVLFALMTAVMLAYMKETVFAAVFAVCCTIATTFVALNGALVTVMREVLKFVSPQYAFYDMIYGRWTLQAIIQPILFTVVFLIFTVLAYSGYGNDAKRGREEIR